MQSPAPPGSGSSVESSPWKIRLNVRVAAIVHASPAVAILLYRNALPADEETRRVARMRGTKAIQASMARSTS